MGGQQSTCPCCFGPRSAWAHCATVNKSSLEESRRPPYIDSGKTASRNPNRGRLVACVSVWVGVSSVGVVVEGSVPTMRPGGIRPGDTGPLYSPRPQKSVP